MVYNVLIVQCTCRYSFPNDGPWNKVFRVRVCVRVERTEPQMSGSSDFPSRRQAVSLRRQIASAAWLWVQLLIECT